MTGLGRHKVVAGLRHPSRRCVANVRCGAGIPAGASRGLVEVDPHLAVLVAEGVDHGVQSLGVVCLVRSVRVLHVEGGLAVRDPDMRGDGRGAQLSSPAPELPAAVRLAHAISTLPVGVRGRASVTTTDRGTL